MHPAVQCEYHYGANNYEPLPVVLTRGEGACVWDDQGRRYLDMMSAYSAVSHGHCHPELVKVLMVQAQTLSVVSRAFYTDQLGPFLQRACEATGLPRALPMNTGAEAVETALKAARRWACTVKGVPENSAEIIACHGNFHGRTIAITGLSTESAYRAGFGPFPPGLRQVPYADADALQKAITPHTAAFLVEPIQGEGGIIVPPPGYLRAVERICRENRVLFMVDEIQTGMGRTGTFLASAHEGVQPDAVMLGKALGGGLLPVSLFLAREEIMAVFTPGNHGSTFGGNPLAAAVGKAALDILFRDDYMTRATELGQYFHDALVALGSPLIREVRGRGLLMGLEIDPRYPAKQLCLNLLSRGILTRDAHGTVIRLAPPLVITRSQLDEAITAIAEVMADAEKTEKTAGSA